MNQTGKRELKPPKLDGYSNDRLLKLYASVREEIRRRENESLLCLPTSEFRRLHDLPDCRIISKPIGYAQGAWFDPDGNSMPDIVCRDECTTHGVRSKSYVVDQVFGIRNLLRD